MALVYKNGKMSCILKVMQFQLNTQKMFMASKQD